MVAPILCAGLALNLTGCATPGPTHAYLAGRPEDPILDVLPGAPDASIPAFLGSGNELYGIAYDPFTDHLFLRIFPGDYIRVIDRPARRIKRSFFVEGLPPGRGDLAIRSSDRHLFFAHPTLPAVVETTLYGRAVDTITLENLQEPPAGVAYDQANDRLLILQAGAVPRIGVYTLAGKLVGSVVLDKSVRPISLAYDSTASEFYAPLLDEPAVGVFNAKGQWLRTLPESGGNPRDFVDVGQRSLLRLF